MGKITFRADEDLIAAIEELDASKSEVMRQALREHLATQRDDPATQTRAREGSLSLDALLADRVETLVGEAVEDHLRSQDLNINVKIDGAGAADQRPATETRKTPATAGSHTDQACGQCGERIDDTHVYCPNCGEKVTHRTFCECGDELRPDWAFCPSCGRRTAAADVLDSSDTG